jgi:Lon protease-like protein
MSLRDMPDVMPVFPLPNVVFFPRTTLPLRVFEPRYRQMVKDVVREGRWITVALLKPGSQETNAENPAFHAVAGAGLLLQSSRLPGDQYNISLEGRDRVRLEEVDSSRLYRLVRVRPHPEGLDWLSSDAGDAGLGELVQTARRIGLLEKMPFQDVPRARIRRETLLNTLASSVLASPEERQRMLEADIAERAELVNRHLRLSEGLIDSLAQRPRPDDPRVN